MTNENPMRYFSRRTEDVHINPELAVELLEHLQGCDTMLYDELLQVSGKVLERALEQVLNQFDGFPLGARIGALNRLIGRLCLEA